MENKQFSKETILSLCEQFQSTSLNYISAAERWKWLYITARWNGMVGQSLHAINFLGIQIRKEETSAYRKPEKTKTFSIEKFRKNIYYVHPDGELHTTLSGAIKDAIKLKTTELCKDANGTVNAKLLEQEIVLP